MYCTYIHTKFYKYYVSVAAAVLLDKRPVIRKTFVRRTYRISLPGAKIKKKTPPTDAYVL